MTTPFPKPKPACLLVSFALVSGCEDFTCEDYATCEPLDSGDVVGDAGGPGSFGGIATSEGSSERTESSRDRDTTSTAVDSGALSVQVTDGSADVESGGSSDASVPDKPEAGDETEGADSSGRSSDGSPTDDAGTDGAVSIDASLDGSLPQHSENDAASSGPAVSTYERSEATTLPETATPSSSSTGGDHSSEGAVTSDDGEPPNCDPQIPFGTPLAITAINLEGEMENVMVAPDGLTMYIRYGGELTTHVATRAAVFEDFGPPLPYAGFDLVLEDEPTLQPRSITADGLTVYLSSDSWGEPIQSAHRETLLDEFDDLTVHEELKAFSIGLGDPWVAPDGDRLYGFLPASFTLWGADWLDPGFEEPVEVYDNGQLSGFALSSSELVLYYGAHSALDDGILRVARSNTGIGFADPQTMSALNSAFYDLPLWVSDDDCEIILAQEGELDGEAIGYTSDIFLARRGL